MNRLRHIDGLRGIAALAVFFQHAMSDIARQATSNGSDFYAIILASVTTVDLGKFGVSLFFMVSGFVVPFSIRPDRNIFAFASARAFRLLPAFWLGVLALAGVLAITGSAVGLRSIFANMTMVPQLFGEGWISGVYWTLFIEALFYGMLIVLFPLRLLTRAPAVFVIATVLLLSSVVPAVLREQLSIGLPVQYIGLHLSLLFTGLLVRLMVVEKAVAARPLAWIMLVAQMVATAVMAQYSVAHGGSFAIAGVMPVLIGLGAAIIVFMVSVTMLRPRSEAMFQLGAMSYSIYLFHGPIFLLIYALVPLTGGWLDLGTIALSLALTLIVSRIVFDWVERPGIALGRAVNAKFFVVGVTTDRRVAPY